MSQFLAARIAADVRGGRTSAVAVVTSTLARIRKDDPHCGAFTDVTADRALAKAAAIDATIASGGDPGSLAGVPFAAKNLFDIDGLPTRAGSKINRDRPPAQRDAVLIEKLEAAGAVLVGGLNMGEYAYDFTGENAHDGPSRNPHDLTRMSGGSSGGSATAAAAGMVPITLGSDTNGSIRVPSSLCGLYGLKPTYGRLSRTGTFPFVASLDHLGPIGRSVLDLSLVYDAMQGVDGGDPAQTDREAEPSFDTLEAGIGELRIATAGGYFARGDMPVAAVNAIAMALGARDTVEIGNAAVARAAAYIITMSEGAALHLDRLRTRADDFDPDTRDRLLAGTMLPQSWYQRAQKVRRVFREQMLELFRDVDVILAPATPVQAPLSGQKTMVFAGEELLVRPNLGLFTQPITLIGLPVLTVPIWLPGETLPIGVQIITAPWREDLALRVGRYLELNVLGPAPVAKEFGDE